MFNRFRLTPKLLDRERSLLLLITDSTLTVSKTIVIIYDSGNSSFLSRPPLPPPFEIIIEAQRSFSNNGRPLYHHMASNPFLSLSKKFSMNSRSIIPAASAKKNISVSISKNYVTRSVCITSGELVGICRWNCRLNGVNVFQRAT